MANRMKEEEKNEKIIRGLLKHPANKRCINCNSLGPQYVCTNFWTFICTNCSGLHREFTHRVKSISMAKFTSQEVSALQEGGNKLAREVYFKEWDPQRHSYPDSSHLDRLRDFIKHVYVERRYSGLKSTDDPPRVKGERSNNDENQRFSTDRSGSRSPPYNDPYEQQYGDRPGSAGRGGDKNSRFNYDARSSVYDQGDYGSPSHFVMRDEIHRDDKDGNDIQSPKSCNNKISDELPKSGVSDHQKGVYILSPPMVRPVREILGGDIPPLRVNEFSKLNDGKAPNNPSEKQGSTSSKSHSDGNSAELKRVNSGSLIDFSVDSEPPAAVAAQESFPQQIGSIPASSGGWASFDISGQRKAPEAASTSGDLESVFAQLSVHASTTVVNSAAISNSSRIESNGRQLPVVQQHSPFSFPCQSTNPPVCAFVGSLSNQVPVQLVGPSFPSAVHGSMNVVDGQTTRPVMHLSHRATAFGNSQNPLEAKASGRKELPADLFTGLYSTSPAPYPGWHMQSHHGMVYRVQYPVMAQPMTYSAAQQPMTFGAAQQPAAYGAVQQPATAFHNPPVSTNPFDLGDESAPTPNIMINPPSASSQAAVQNHNDPLSLPNRPALATGPSQWTATQQLSYPSSALPGPYMEQQFPDNMPRSSFSTVDHGVAGVGSEATSLNSSRLPTPTASYMGSRNSSLSSVGGNPFG